RRPADPVLHAAVGRRRLESARLQQLALPRSEQPRDAGRVPHHDQPLPRPRVLLRHRQGRGADEGYRFHRPEGRLRLRRAVARPVLDSASRRAVEEPRSPILLDLFDGSVFLGLLHMLTAFFSTRSRHAALLALSIGTAGLLTTPASMQTPKFYPDDPIARAPESRDASTAAPYDES